MDKHWHLPFGILMMLLFAVEFSKSQSRSTGQPDSVTTPSPALTQAQCMIPDVASPGTPSSVMQSTNVNHTEIASVFAGIVPASMVESMQIQTGPSGTQFNLKGLFQSGQGALIEPSPTWAPLFLEKLKGILDRDTNLKVIFLGMSESSEWFADHYKTDWELGAARAAALGTRLEKLGVEDSRIEIHAQSARLGESIQVRVFLSQK